MSISYDVCEGTLSDGGLGRSFAALSASDLASGASVGVRVAAASASARRALARVITCASWHAAAGFGFVPTRAAVYAGAVLAPLGTAVARAIQPAVTSAA